MFPYTCQMTVYVAATTSLCPSLGKRNIVASYDCVFKNDGLKRTNVADSAADGLRITKAKRREVLDRAGRYVWAGADLPE